MIIKIALILSVILQFGAAIIALSLVKRTRTNITWWLISLGFLLMAFRRVFELFEIYNVDYKFTSQMLSSWTGVVISIIMLVSLAFVRHIFNLQKRFDQLRKQNEARVLSAIIKTEEKERQHFAKELHDGLGPLLSSVKMAISAKRSVDKTKDKIIINAEKLIDESIITLKEISNNLSPHILNNFGLHKAIKSFIGKLNIAEKPKIKYKSNIKDERFAHNIEVVLFRVVCELISNSLQHANANNIYIDIIKNKHQILLQYIDDGDGFNLKENNFANKGQGFSNIKSRIKSLNGQYNFFTSQDEGIKVKIIININ